jgi:hypothetical protein
MSSGSQTQTMAPTTVKKTGPSTGWRAGRVRHPGAMDIAIFVIAMVSALLTAAFVIGLFVWAAKKDGQEDEETQRRLGIRRRTWL